MFRALLARDEVRAVQATPWGVWPGESTQVAGVEVNQSSAMQLLAVAGCVRYITDTISTLPVDVFTASADGRKEVTPPVWLKEPTPDLDFTAWCSQTLTSLLLHGNSYSVVLRGESGINSLVPVDPTTVTVVREHGRKRFKVAGQLFPGEILHIKGMMLPGSDVGLSPLEYARLSIGLGLEAVQYGTDNFQNQLNLPGHFEFPNKMQPDTMRETARSWQRSRQGKKGRGLPGIVTEGGKFVTSGVTNEQAQFLQTRQWTAAEIAGQVYLVDPVELGIPVSGTSIQYGNIEQRAIATTRRAFQPWMIRIEHAIDGLLPRPRYMKFNVDGLLRADSTARWDVYSKAAEINAKAAALGQPPVLDTLEMRDFENYGPSAHEFTAPPAPVAAVPFA
jgi:HK97 family phage portal protein